MIRRLLLDQQNPERTAVIEGGRAVPYCALQKRAGALASLLPKNGGNIAVLLPSSGDYIAALWGILAAGMTALPLNPLMTASEILPLLRQSSACAVVTCKGFEGIFRGLPQSGAPAVRLIFIDDLGGEAIEFPCAAADASPDDPMLLMGTSGTTGTSKIVKLSERNVMACVLGYLDKLRFDETALGDVRYTLAVPFSSIYGMMILSACLLRSFPLVIIDSDFTLDNLFRAAEIHRITHYEGSSTTILMMEQMVGRPIPFDISTLKYFGFGGSKVTGETIDRLYAAYPGAEFFQGYGMTEAAPLIAKHPQGRLTKTDSVGTAIKGMEIAIARGGEILARGPNVMLGYLDNQIETDKALVNGWLYTGDIGHLDSEGFLYIRGRKKSVIIVRGHSVYPEEVESCIQNSGLAADCLVFGQPDGFGGELVCADVVPISGDVSEGEIMAHCAAHLAEYKRPHKISLQKSITKTGTGKAKRPEAP